MTKGEVTLKVELSHEELIKKIDVQNERINLLVSREISLNNQIRELKAKVREPHELKKKNQKLHNEVNSLKTSIKDRLEKQIEELKEKNEKLEQGITDKILKDKNQIIFDLTSERDKLLKDNKEMEKRIEVLLEENKQINVIKTDLEKLKYEIEKRVKAEKEKSDEAAKAREEQEEFDKHNGNPGT